MHPETKLSGCDLESLQSADESTQTSSVSINDSSPIQSHSYVRPPLPRDIENQLDKGNKDKGGKGQIKISEFCQLLQDSEDPEDVTLVKETIFEETIPHPVIKDPESCSPISEPPFIANRYRYCKEVIKPYLKDSVQCTESEDELLRNVLDSVSQDFPDYKTCKGVTKDDDNRCKEPEPSCKPVCPLNPCSAPKVDACSPIMKHYQDYTVTPDPEVPTPGENSKPCPRPPTPSENSKPCPRPPTPSENSKPCPRPPTSSENIKPCPRLPTPAEDSKEQIACSDAPKNQCEKPTICDKPSKPKKPDVPCQKEPAIGKCCEDSKYYLTERCKDMKSIPNVSIEPTYGIPPVIPSVIAPKSSSSHEKSLSTIICALDDFVSKVTDSTKNAVNLIATESANKISKLTESMRSKCSDKGPKKTNDSSDTLKTFNLDEETSSEDEIEDTGSAKLKNVFGSIMSKVNSSLSELSSQMAVGEFKNKFKISNFNDTSSQYDNPSNPPVPRQMSNYRQTVISATPSPVPVPAPNNAGVFAAIKEKIVSMFYDEPVKLPSHTTVASTDSNSDHDDDDVPDMIDKQN